MDRLIGFLIPSALAQNNNLTRGDFMDIFRFRRGNSDPNADHVTNLGAVFDFVAIVINWFLVITMVVAFIYLVLYGTKYITSGGDAAKATEARNGIIYAIIGLIVIALAFFIIRFAVNFANAPANPISPNPTP